MTLSSFHAWVSEKQQNLGWGGKTFLFVLSLVVAISIWVVIPTSFSCHGFQDPAKVETRNALRALLNENRTEEKVTDTNFYALIYRDPALHERLKGECIAQNNLEEILKDAAMADGTVVLTLYTGGFYLITDLFFARMRIGEGTFQFLKHAVVVTFNPFDKASCCQRHLHCYFDNQEDSTMKFNSAEGAKFYLSYEYIAMAWRKIELKSIVVQMGYNVIYTDIDVLWLRNPLPHFASDHDFITGCDDAKCLKPNTGFYFVKSNNRTIAFYKLWLDVKKNCSDCSDQMGLNRILPSATSDIGLKTLHLKPHIFGTLCQYPKDFSQLVTLHSVCCVGFINKYVALNKFLTQYDWYKVVTTH